MRYLWTFVVAAIAAAGCAARSNAVRTANLEAEAAELVRQGCYDCLREARELYERAPAARRQAVLTRLLEVDLLLVLREKELALDPAESLARARVVAAELGSAADMSRYVAIVESVVPDRSGTPLARRPFSPLTAGREGLEASLSAIAASPFLPIFRDYLTATIECGRPPLGPAQPARTAPAAEVPLLLYRASVCERVDTEPLERVRAAVPRFVETSLFMGRAAMATVPFSDGTRARQHLEDAYTRFPHSPAVTFHLATVTQATGDCRRAEEYFSETLAIYADHDEARLGRAICRTYLANPDGAIEDATILIDTSAPNRADGYYWRAWNKRAKKLIEDARMDIDGARALRYNAQVLTLAGMIEHDQGEFDAAREDLSRASDMDSRECQARWYLGLVGYATGRWAESAAGFADAADCYTWMITQTEAKREEMRKREDISEEFRTRQLTGFDAAIAEDSTQRSAADLNAALNYARAGEVDSATTYMKRAWVDPQRRTTIEDLRQVLGVPRW